MYEWFSFRKHGYFSRGGRSSRLVRERRGRFNRTQSGMKNTWCVSIWKEKNVYCREHKALRWKASAVRRLSFLKSGSARPVFSCYAPGELWAEVAEWQEFKVSSTWCSDGEFKPAHRNIPGGLTLRGWAENWLGPVLGGQSRTLPSGNQLPYPAYTSWVSRVDVQFVDAACWQ